MAGTTISTVSTIGISLSSKADNPVSILSTGGINVTSGLYALAADSSGFFVPGSFTITNSAAPVTDTAPGSSGITLTGGGTVHNVTVASGNYPNVTYSFGTISGDAVGVAISGGPGTVTNQATIQATATSGVGVSLSAGGTVQNSSFLHGRIPLFGTIGGGAVGVAISGGLGTVTNQGSIQATATSGVGVSLSAGGTVTNTAWGLGFGDKYHRGVIEGGASAAAVRITGGGGLVRNNGGLIAVGANIGVYLGAGGVVSNGTFGNIAEYLTGTISGAVYGVLSKGGPATVGNVGLISGSQFGVVITGGPAQIINNNAYVYSHGTISGSQFGVMTTGGPATVFNAGVIIGQTAVALPAGYANLLQVSGGTFIGLVNGGNTIGAAVGSTLELFDQTVLSGLGDTITNFGTILFHPLAQSFLSGNTAGIAGGEVFDNFAAGDTINITGITGETIVGFNANTLTLGGTTPLNIIILAPATATAANFQLYNNATSTDIVTNLAGLPCFAAGTHILTDVGEIAVEKIRVGDRVVTAMTGGTAPVVWIGRRHVRPRRHPRPETVQPVIIQPDAFGPGRPHRVLRLSPDHAVFFDDVLIPVGLLVNGHGIVREDVAEVTYYHLELPEHDVLYAERLPCESYLATADVAAFDNGGVVVALHPAFAPAAIWETMGCAPLIKCGERLIDIREKLSARVHNSGRHALSSA